MRVLVLGGTSWLGGTVAASALACGHEVVCLARGSSGAVPSGARFVRSDRWAPGAYDAVRSSDWDLVVEVSWQPALVRSALAALAQRVRHWIYVSSVSVYADGVLAGGDEADAVLPAWQADGDAEAPVEAYGAAKVSCETATAELIDPRSLLVARAGLIAGYGDRSDRFGYWPARVARGLAEDPVLVPAMHTPVQYVDVADLAAWLVSAGAERRWGVFDAVGEPVTLADVVTASGEVSLSHPRPVERDDAWLTAQGVAPWAGPGSLPLWLPQEAHGLMRRSGRAARDAGLVPRPLDTTVADSLRWEVRAGLGRERRAGLTPAREAELLAR